MCVLILLHMCPHTAIYGSPDPTLKLPPVALGFGKVAEREPVLHTYLPYVVVRGRGGTGSSMRTHIERGGSYADTHRARGVVYSTLTCRM
jgi:hypothetical protein